MQSFATFSSKEDEERFHELMSDTRKETHVSFSINTPYNLEPFLNFYKVIIDIINDYLPAIITIRVVKGTFRITLESSTKDMELELFYASGINVYYNRMYTNICNIIESENSFVKNIESNVLRLFEQDQHTGYPICINNVINHWSNTNYFENFPNCTCKRLYNLGMAKNSLHYKKKYYGMNVPLYEPNLNMYYIVRIEDEKMFTNIILILKLLADVIRLHYLFTVQF